jgi:hypothetical protein
LDITYWTLIALAVVVGINTLFLAGLAAALFLVQRRLDEALGKAEPLLAKAAVVLQKIEETTAALQPRLERVLEKTVSTADQVADRVDRTSARAEEAVTEPLIGVASLLTGINRGLQTYVDAAAAGVGAAGRSRSAEVGKGREGNGG